jgi:hypothetical protein
VRFFVFVVIGEIVEATINEELAIDNGGPLRVLRLLLPLKLVAMI